MGKLAVVHDRQVRMGHYVSAVSGFAVNGGGAAPDLRVERFVSEYHQLWPGTAPHVKWYYTASLIKQCNPQLRRCWTKR